MATQKNQIKIPRAASTADNFLDKLPAPDAVTWIKDDHVKLTTGSLSLKVSTAGRKTWIYRYSFNGAGKNKTIGTYPAVKTNEARTLASEMSQLVSNGTDPIQQEREEEQQAEQIRLSKVTIQQLHDRWIEKVLADRHKDGGAFASHWIKTRILPRYGALEVDKFHRAHLVEVLEEMRLEGKTRAANVVLSNTKQMFNYAVKAGYLDVNPVTILSKDDAGGRDTERDRVLCGYIDPDTGQRKPDELKELFAKMPDSGLSINGQLAVKIILSTACRVGEVLKARWSDVDMDLMEWTIPVENSKNGKPHMVNLSDYAASQFKELHSITGCTEWLFPAARKDGGVCPKSLTKQITDRQKPAGKALKGRSSNKDGLVVPGGKWTPHDLRRTAATIMGESGVMPDIIERCLNHVEQNRMARIYQRHTPRQQMLEAWQVLGERLQAIENGADNVVSLDAHRTA